MKKEEQKIRVITTRKDIPEDTVSHKGFHLLNMGNEGTWLVDSQHPGYEGCIKKAIQLAEKRGDTDAAEKYSKLPRTVSKKTIDSEAK